MQTLPSSQFFCVPDMQAPFAHTSPMVQALLSLQGAVLLVCTQLPVAASQESSVQTLPSSQFFCAPEQTPPEHTSPVVQALLSLHGAVLLVCTQLPVAASQESSVQILPSSQFFCAPGMQAPFAHTSPMVQALLSEQGAVLLVNTQAPVVVLQVSSVQTLLSSHTLAGPGKQTPPEHASFVVQALPSLHGAVLLVCTHPDAGSQVSSVQTLLSSQLGAGPPTQTPPEHASFVVQALLSEQGAVLLVCVQGQVPGPGAVAS